MPHQRCFWHSFGKLGTLVQWMEFRAISQMTTKTSKWWNFEFDFLEFFFLNISFIRGIRFFGVRKKIHDTTIRNRSGTYVFNFTVTVRRMKNVNKFSHWNKGMNKNIECPCPLMRQFCYSFYSHWYTIITWMIYSMQIRYTFYNIWHLHIFLNIYHVNVSAH